MYFIVKRIAPPPDNVPAEMLVTVSQQQNCLIINMRQFGADLCIYRKNPLKKSNGLSTGWSASSDPVLTKYTLVCFVINKMD